MSRVPFVALEPLDYPETRRLLGALEVAIGAGTIPLRLGLEVAQHIGLRYARHVIDEHLWTMLEVDAADLSGAMPDEADDG